MTTTTAVDPYAALNGSTATTATQTTTSSDGADRFLKLLVAQMQNQDPMNPLDNAQVTSQMAQISTVSGIETLNKTVSTLNTQFLQMQAVQGASLVGHDVSLAGNKVVFDGTTGQGVGGFDLAGPADNVKVEILDSAGRLTDTLDLGAQESGRHGFEWTPKKDGEYTFRVTAKAGATDVTSTALMRDHVEAVSTDGDVLMLQLSISGSVPYSAVKSFN